MDNLPQPENNCKFVCELCDFKCCKQSDFNRHLITNKHVKNANSNINKCILCDYTCLNNKNYIKHLAVCKNKKYAGVKIIFCEICNVDCCKPSAYKQHLLTRKHKQAESNIKSFICLCGKAYKDNSGLWRHKKKCISINKTENDDSLNKEQIEKIDNLTNMVTNLVEKSSIINNNVVNTVNNVNNVTNITAKFNLNMYLNKECKDAMNIMDFANSLQIKMKELEDVGRLGYATGISNIIIRGLKDLEVNKRPIHCSDIKRETLHIKDKDIWEQDKDNALFITAIKKVARKNMMKVYDWKAENPDFNDLQSKTIDKYTQILIEATGPCTEEEKEKGFNKIIRTVAKEVTIDKPLAIGHG